MKAEMYPDSSVIRFDYPQRGVHPALKIYWYDGGKRPPAEISGRAETTDASGRPLRGGGGGLTWIGTKGSYPAGRGPFYGSKIEEYPTPEPRDWQREDVYKDWVVAVRAGRPAPCHFGYAGPFTEAYLLGNVALRVGHRIEYDALQFRVTNCSEANPLLTREYRRGWDLQEIAGKAYNEPGG
jgi:hypothetical protein